MELILITVKWRAFSLLIFITMNFQISGVIITCCHGIIQLFEAEARLNIFYQFSPYRKENTTLHHYKDQLVNAV
jgi:hypothetical protein